jgi:hypothetical protein
MTKLWSKKDDSLQGNTVAPVHCQTIPWTAVVTPPVVWGMQHATGGTCDFVKVLRFVQVLCVKAKLRGVYIDCSFSQICQGVPEAGFWGLGVGFRILQSNLDTCAVGLYTTSGYLSAPTHCNN